MLLIFLNFNTTFAQQILVNQEWTTSTGQPNGGNAILTGWDNFAWSASTLDNFGNLITTGNTLVTAGNTDVLLTKYNTSGQILWQKTFDGGNNGYDYGLAVEMDNWGNFYIAGTTTATNGFLDYFIIKTNSSGTQLWTYNWNGSSSLHDVPSAIYLDNSGNPFIVGGTYNLQDGVDVALVKLSSTGTLLWASIYDHVGLDDVSLSIKKWNVFGSILEVSAISSSAQGQWDVAKIRFSAISGGVQGEIRVPVPQLHLQDVNTFTSDDDGNLFLASAVQGSNTGKDVEVVKVSSSGVDWVETIDYKGFDDLPKSIAVDNNGNIFLSASAEKPGGIDILTIKMDTNGNELWRRPYLAPKNQKVAEPVKIKTDNNGNVFVTGLVRTQSGVQDYTTFMYDESGTLRFDLKLDANNGSIDTPTDIVLSASGDEFFVTGESDNGGSMEYVTVKYEKRKEDNIAVYVSGVANHFDKQLIVKFKPQLLDLSFVDNKGLIFGDLYDILPSSVVEDIERDLNIDLSKDEIIIEKIYKNLTTADSISITRLGDEIRMPNFWSSFLLHLPDVLDTEQTLTTFQGISSAVLRAELNQLRGLNAPPNDEYYASGQDGLKEGDGGINVQGAWDFETGQEYVKVGVFDDAIYWRHGDFGNGTWDGTKVKGGKDYTIAMPGSIENVGPVLNSHGTAVAGIIGALRNNGFFGDLGIAGIAGGDGNSIGAHLYSLKIADDNGFISNANIAAAIVESCSNTGEFGFGLDITNHSYGTHPNNLVISEEEREAVKWSARNQSIFVASRGNRDGSLNGLTYPACFNDEWVLNTGASGYDGELLEYDNGDPDGVPSLYNGTIDFLAPGVKDLITTTIAPALPMVANCIVDDGVAYSCFRATSAAAPHVSGVAALMYSKHHVNQGQWYSLAPEDIEYVLQATAKYGGGGGGDIDKYGYGLINAAEAIKMIKFPKYRVFHSGVPTVQVGAESSPMLITVERPLDLGGNTTLASGGYVATRVEVVHNYQDVFSSFHFIEWDWRRLNSVLGYSSSSTINGDMYATYFPVFSGFNEANVTMRTYCFKLVVDGEVMWIPAPPEDLKTAYSFLLNNLNVLDDIEEVITDIELNIFPNPTSELITITYDAVLGQLQLVEIFNASGQLALKKNIENKEGGISVNIAHLPEGIYICKMMTPSGIAIGKFIKQ